MAADNHERIFRQAIDAGRNRDYTRAARLLTRIVTCTDRFPHALLYLGRSYHALGQHAKAVQILSLYLKTMPDSEPGHFFIGRVYLALGQLKRAIDNLRFVAERNPGFAPCQGLLGLAYLKLRRPNTAVRYFESALKNDPDNERLLTGYLNALLIKGIRLFHRRKNDEAEQIFRFILDRRPDSILAHIYLGKIYREVDRADLALRHYDEAARLSPGDPVFPMLKAFILMGSGKTVAALQELDKTKNLLGSLPIVKDPAILLRIITVTLFRNKRYREAIFHARQILKENYRDAEIHGLMAESYMHLGEYEKSRNHFMRSIETNRLSLEYHHGLALALWELKDYKALQSEIAKIRHIEPSDKMARYLEALCKTEIEDPTPDTIKPLQDLIRELGPDVHLMYALARAYLSNDRPDLSEGWLLRTLKLDEGHRQSYLDLIKVYRALGRREKTKSTFAQYFTIFPDDGSRKSDYIRILIEMEDYSAASLELTALLSRDPHNRMLKKNLAYCHVKLEDFGEATLLYRDLLKDQPNSVPLLRSLIACLDRTGNQQLAINILQKAIEHFGDTPAVLLPLGVLYSRSKKFEKAKEIFRKVLAIRPDDWRAYQNLAVLYKRTGQDVFAAKFLKTAQKYRS